MRFPPDFILSLIKEPCILHFKDTTFDPAAPAHFYVTIPVEPGQVFLVSIITSREKRVNYYSNNKRALKSLVLVDDKTWSFLNRASVIDCNRTELLTRVDFVKRIDTGWHFEIKKNGISYSLGVKILTAIQGSPLLSPRLKRALRLIDASALFTQG